MSFAQGHNALNAFVPVRLKLEFLGLESSTLALNKKKESLHWMFFCQYAYTYAFIIHVTEYERL